MNHGFGDKNFLCSHDLRKRKKNLGEDGFPLHQDINSSPFEYDAEGLKNPPQCVVFCG
jgi:hypothetical protein